VVHQGQVVVQEVVVHRVVQEQDLILY
jgi:hypothetical protein